MPAKTMGENSPLLHLYLICGTSRLVKIQQADTDDQGWPAASVAFQKRIDRRLAAWNQVGQLLLGQPSREEI